MRKYKSGRISYDFLSDLFFMKLSFSFKLNYVIIDTNRVKVPKNKNPYMKGNVICQLIIREKTQKGYRQQSESGLTA